MLPVMWLYGVTLRLRWFSGFVKRGCQINHKHGHPKLFARSQSQLTSLLAFIFHVSYPWKWG